MVLVPSQEFDPQEFSSALNESTQDAADPSLVLNFMSSSHMPYILNRLKISLEADDEGIEHAYSLCIQYIVQYYTIHIMYV